MTNASDSGDRKNERKAATARAEALRPEAVTNFELALIVAYNAFEQWVMRCGIAAGAAGFSALDLLVISLVNNLLRDKRAADICFALKIEDMHTVSYSLKKLSNAGLVAIQRNGKEALFSTTPAGVEFCARYQANRRKNLVDAMQILTGGDFDVVEIANRLRALTGVYEQAARNVTTGI